MNSVKSSKNRWPKFFLIFFLFLLLGAYAQIFAIGSPYTPGATLNPACPPGEVNCTVDVSPSQWTTTGSDIYYDSGNIGIGTTSPEFLLNLVSETSNNVILDLYNNSTSSHSIAGRRALGTKDAPMAVTTNTYLFAVGGRGYGTTGFSTNSRSAIGFNASENWTDTAQGAYIRFVTTPLGTITTLERMRITSEGNVGIGTTDPVGKLEVVQDGALWLYPFYSTSYGDTAVPGLVGRHARGTLASPLATQESDSLSVFSGRGYTGSAFETVSPAQIKMVAAEDHNDTNQGSYMGFWTTQIGDQSNLRAERMRILDNGNVGIGDTTPDHLLDVAGNIGLDALSYINFGDTDGTTGYGFRDNTGIIEVKNSGGSWVPATSPVTVVNSSNLYSTGLSGTGSGATTTNSIFLGVNAGSGATGSNDSNFFGQNAGLNATSATYSNFFGQNAGSGSSSVYSNFFGLNAGQGSSVSSSNFFGFAAGINASGSDSNFFGNSAGANSGSTLYSNFLGTGAGSGATSASYSNFLGEFTGYKATGVEYSNLFGYRVGASFPFASPTNIIGDNNIIIGKNISLPNATANAINIGGVLFGTGTYNTIVGDPSILPANGRIGINVVLPSATLEVNGTLIIADTVNSDIRLTNNPSSSIVFGSTDSGNSSYIENNSANDSLTFGSAINGGYIYNGSSNSLVFGKTDGTGSYIYNNNSNTLTFGVAKNGGIITNSSEGGLAFGYADGSGSQIESIYLGAQSFGVAENGYNITAGDYGTLAFGYASGGDITANYYSSFAGGHANANDIFAGGDGSFAFGYANEGDIYVNADGATAFGSGTNANSYLSFVLGRFNVGGGTYNSWVATDSLFEIGNGTSDVARANALTVLKNGNVGIGIANPAYILDVYNSGTGIMAQFSDSTTGSCTIDPAIVGAISCSSDINLKKNIINLEENTPYILNEDIVTDNTALSKILALNTVTYNFKGEDDSDNKHTGFIAQEVEQLFPDLVSENPKGLAVNYVGFSPYIISAIQELNLKVEELQISNPTASTMMSDFFGGVVVDIKDGIAHLTNLVVDTLKVGSSEKPTGITLYDEVTGNPYCLSIANGETKTTEGECGIFISTPETIEMEKITETPIITETEIIIEEITPIETEEQVVEIIAIETPTEEPIEIPTEEIILVP